MDHTFQPGKIRRGYCSVCRQAVWHSNHTGKPLAGMETTDLDREIALAVAKSQEMSAELLRPLGSISKKAGNMERNSPLFHGKGDQPTLF